MNAYTVRVNTVPVEQILRMFVPRSRSERMGYVPRHGAADERLSKWQQHTARVMRAVADAIRAYAVALRQTLERVAVPVARGLQAYVAQLRKLGDGVTVQIPQPLWVHQRLCAWDRWRRERAEQRKALAQAVLWWETRRMEYPCLRQSQPR